MSNVSTVLSKPDLRATKPSRDEFAERARRPIRIVLDGVTGNYNVGAIFRLCDAMLVERLVICGTSFALHKRRLTQAAQGAQRWVPWEHSTSVEQSVIQARADGYQIVVVELTSTSIAPEKLVARFPVCLVIGSERSGVTQSIVNLADATIAIPMLGMSNSLNLATATSIVLYEVCKQYSTEEAPRSQ